jgi:lipoprotein-anchoring transpeptidase ErfK/SrfK
MNSGKNVGGQQMWWQSAVIALVAAIPSLLWAQGSDTPQAAPTALPPMARPVSAGSLQQPPAPAPSSTVETFPEATRPGITPTPPAANPSAIGTPTPPRPIRRIAEAKPMHPQPDIAADEPGVARAGIVTERELSAQLQIFLDQQLFSPGRIDGKGGLFTQRALMRWQRANGFEPTGVVDANVPYKNIFPVYTNHTVQPSELKLVGTLPSKPQEQAKRKGLPYASLLEFLSERYHCSPEFLQKLNPGVKFAALAEGSTVRVPNVAPFKIEEVLAPGNLSAVPEFTNRRIVVNRKETFLEVYDGEKAICAIPIAPGSPKHPTPKGKFKILGIATMPVFRWDKGVLEYGKRTDNFHMLPPGPNNPVGVVWMGLNKPGIGIHGTNNPASIGSWASHGCMRTANWDAIRLASLVSAGCVVEIE